jgi:peptidoglycan/xylan/chitin deacetylase (PgdA/CDA1 family)
VPDTPAERVVFLTFDDGPHPEHTRAVLDVLKAEGLTGTFFVIGRNVERHGTRLLERAVAEGSGVANHTQTHPKLPDLPPARVAEEIAACDKLVAPFLQGRKLFRPPYGAKNAAVEKAVTDAGYKLVMWDVDTVDWSKDNQPAKWVDLGMRGFERAKGPRAVVLLHDLHPGTAANLAAFIRRVRALGGVRFGKPDEL